MFEADGIESDEEVRGLPKRVCCFRGGVPEAIPPVIFLTDSKTPDYLSNI